MIVSFQYDCIPQGVAGMDQDPAVLIIMLFCALTGIGGVLASRGWLRSVLWFLSVLPFCIGLLLLSDVRMFRGKVPGFELWWSFIFFWPAAGCLIGDILRHWHAAVSVPAVIYLSQKEEAARYENAPVRFRDRVEYRGITTQELTKLWRVMREAEGRDASLVEFPCLHQSDNGRRFVHQLPTEMVEGLSRLTPEKTAVVTEKWSGREVWGWSEEAARRLVGDLVRLSRMAVESGRGVYLWNRVS